MAGMSPSRRHVTTAVECLGPRERSRCTFQVLGVVGWAETTCSPFLALILWGHAVSHSARLCHVVSHGVISSSHNIKRCHATLHNDPKYTRC